MKPRVFKRACFWWVRKPTSEVMGPYVNWWQAMFIATHPKLWI